MALRQRVTLTRRTLIGSTAALTAGCGFLDSPDPAPMAPQPTELTWVSDPYLGLSDRQGGTRPREKLQQALAALRDDEENPHGPKRGRYNVTLRYVEISAIPNDYTAWLEEIEADLVSVHAGNAKAMAESGLWLPLDRFMGAADPMLEDAFYPSLVEQFRHGALYALPIDARPLMLNYDAAYFAREQVPPPTDDGWNWDDLLEYAAKLTMRRENGSAARWGLMAHRDQVWWALWQNLAEVVNTDTLQCRLQEAPAVEALQFIWDLIHTHQVSPRGRARTVPVYADMGIAIAARTKNAEAAYTALKGLVHALQPRVNVPATKEGVARLGESRTDIRPDEVAALQHSIEHGRAMPQHVPAVLAMNSVLKSLQHGDDVATMVNQACFALYESQRA